jgi:tRNA (guanine-N7-)-methyltransferase
MDWSSYYPAFVLDTSAEQIVPENPAKVGTGGAVKKLKQDVEVADIGCGFGGLTVALAPLMPNTLILGL